VGTIWRILRYPILIASMVLIPKVMTAPLYGQFSVFLSVYMLCETFTGLGNMQVFGRFLPTYAPEDDAGRRRFLHGMLLYGVLITLAIMGTASVILIWWHPESFQLSWIAAIFLVLVFGKIQGTFFSYLYGLNQIGRFSSRDLIRSFSRFAVVLGLFWAFGLYGAVWAFVVNELVLVLISGWWIRKDLFARVGVIPWREIRGYMVFGLAFYVPTVLVGMLQRSGEVLIALWSGKPEEVAYFNLANQFLMLTVSFLGILLATLLPSLATFKERGDHRQAEQWMRHAVVFCVAMAVLALYALAFIGPVVIPIIGKSYDFERVYGNALILGAAAFPLLLVHVGSNWAVLQKDAVGYAVISGISAVLMIGLAWVLVPGFGSLGASLASLIAYVIFALLFCLRYWSIMRVMLLGVLRVLACALPAGALYFAPLPDFSGGGITLSLPFVHSGGLSVTMLELWQAGMFVLAAAGFAVVLVASRTIRVGDIRKYAAKLKG
jgi:O-antigen/teichoic acid export membrane protein